MKRILGTNGAPQQVQPISADLLPVFDTADVGVDTGNRTIYLDLYAYCPRPINNGFNQGGAPAFWTGMSGETPYYDIEDNTQAFFYVVTSNEQTLEDAIASSSRRIANEAVGFTDILGSTVPPPKFPSLMNMYGPTHLLSRYPLTSGETVHFVHNINTGYPTYIWGYYTIEGEESLDVAVRPLQPDPSVSPENYDPAKVSLAIAATDSEIVHTVSDDYIDEITLELKIAGYEQFDSGTDPSVHRLLFENGPATPMTIGAGTGDTDYANNMLQSQWIRWFDGIPMKGVGAISIERFNFSSGTTYARGLFKRY